MWMQQFIHPVLDVLAQGVTMLGEDVASVVVVMLFLWCVDKKFGFQLGIICMTSAFCNGIVKMILKVPRPWTRGVQGYIPPLRMETATGYSMPSGHSQAAAVLGAALMGRYRRFWQRVLLALGILLVGLSRIYCRVHTWQDVALGLALGVLCALALGKLAHVLLDEAHPWRMLLLIVPAALGMALVWDSGVWKTGGMLIAAALGYVLEVRYVRLQVRAHFWQHALKMALGIGTALALRAGLKALLGASVPADGLRYALMGLWLSLGAPWLFQVCKLYRRDAKA